MSKLDHAKRVSKRLFKLAKESPTNQIKINSLSDAFKCISTINGYKDWHDYTENLIRQDYISNEELPKKYDSFNNPEFDEIYEKEYENNFNPPVINIKNYNIVKNEVEENMQSLVLGHQKINKMFEKPKEHYLTEYPLLISGTTGAGKTEGLLSLANQIIENKQGIIYVDGKSDVSVFYKIFTMCNEYKRLKDLYVINFMTYDVGLATKKITNSIDPINPLIGYEKNIVSLFGDLAGKLVNRIGLSLREESKGISLEILESILSLPTLIYLYNNNLFNDDVKKILLNYFNKDLSLEIVSDFNFQLLDEEIKKKIYTVHAEKFNRLRLFLNVCKVYPHLFKIDSPDVSIQEIYAEKKILLVLLPALEKSTDELIFLSDIIMSQIHIASQYFDNQDKNYIYQNVIVDEARYTLSESITNVLMNNLPKSTNWIFGIQDFAEHKQTNKLGMLISKCNSFGFLKCEDVGSIPDSLIGRITRNTKTNHHVFSNSLNLRDLTEGQCWIYQNKTFEYIDFIYKEVKGNNYCFLPN